MYIYLREMYRWNDMKTNIAKFVVEYPNCKQVNIEHQRLGGLSQDVEIPTLKWEDVNMDFLTCLPRK